MTHNVDSRANLSLGRLDRIGPAKCNSLVDSFYVNWNKLKTIITNAAAREGGH